MPSLNELRERAGEVVKEMRKIADEYNQRKAAGKTGDELWPSETDKRWKELHTEHEQLRPQIAAERSEADRNAAIAEFERQYSEGEGRHRPNAGNDREQRDHRDQFRDREAFAETRDLALQAWAGRNYAACQTDRHRRAAEKFGINIEQRELIIELYDTAALGLLQEQSRSMHPSRLRAAAIDSREESRALSAFAGSAGGFVIGSTLVGALELNMLAYGAVEQVAEVMVTDTGEEMAWPTADDTSNEGEIVGENPTSANTADPTFAQVKFGAYEFSSKLVKVPVPWLEDAPANMASVLGRMLGERLGRAKNRKFTAGTGANQPRGVMVAATLGKTTASATAIAADEVKDLVHSVDPAYRNQPGAGFMLHDAVLLSLSKLKGSDGQYIWQSGLQQGLPDRLLGYGLDVNQHMDSAVTASNKTMLFGARRQYKVRRVRRLRLLRLDERFAELSQVGFIAFERADGNLLDAGTAPLKYLQQHA